MSKLFNVRILFSFIVLLTAVALIVGATSAFFSDTETSIDNDLTAGAIDLKIDNSSYYNRVLNTNTTWLLNDLTDQLFFNFSDVKPGDIGEDTISLHAQNNYWLCANLTLTANDDNTCTEPELLDDPSCNESNDNLSDGELAQEINFVFWADDGDNVFEDNEPIIKEGTAKDVLDSDITLADSTTNNLGGVPGDPVFGGEDGNNQPITTHIGKAWCFGKLTKTPVPAGQGVNPTVDGGFICDGSLVNNASQTDKVLADIQFDAVQSRNNPNFVCPTRRPTIACNGENVIYASSATNIDQGLRKDGTAVLSDRSDPSFAFGAPQTAGSPTDSVTPNSFYSLGFPNVNNSTKSASIVFGFDKTFYNGPGDDLQIFEVTGGSYPDEKVKVEASKDGISWTLLSPSATRDASLDLGSLDFANYVRLTDVSDINSFEPTADGYDVDAVKALCTAVDSEN